MKNKPIKKPISPIVVAPLLAAEFITQSFHSGLNFKWDSLPKGKKLKENVAIILHL